MVVVRRFRKRLSLAYRAQQESFSRVTATLAESVSGIREIQGFVRNRAVWLSVSRIIWAVESPT